tara:strand:+ start:93 stop:467 length:375 start_codon:yes stop_codon:yes gene_type:complete
MLKKILSKIMKNDLGFDPNKWFDSEKKEPPSWEDTAPSEYEPPVDNRWAPPERRAELEAELNPRPEEEIAEWFSDKKENPDESDTIEEEKTMHQKMYEIATAKYNPFSVGGSENLGGGSEEIQK